MGLILFKIWPVRPVAANVDGVLLDVNDSFCRLTGYSREELINKRKYQDFTPGEYHEYEAGVIETMLKTGEPAFRQES